MNTWWKVGIALVLIAIGAASGSFVTREMWKADVATVRSDNATVLQGLADSAATTAALVHKAYDTQVNAFAAIDAKHIEDGKNAKHDQDLLVAGLLNGTVRLRDEWATCRSTVDALAGSGSARPDAGANDRAASAGRIVRAARDADDTIRRLQDILRAERGTATPPTIDPLPAPTTKDVEQGPAIDVSPAPPSLNPGVNANVTLRSVSTGTLASGAQGAGQTARSRPLFMKFLGTRWWCRHGKCQAEATEA